MASSSASKYKQMTLAALSFIKAAKRQEKMVVRCKYTISFK